MMEIVLGITGCSGSIYGIRLFKELVKKRVRVHLIISDVAKKIIRYETDATLSALKKNAYRYYDNEDLFAAPASGSFLHDGMAIAPCSMKTLAGIAHGYAETLIVRSADVCLKEGRKLVLMPRETPLSLVDLKNMVAVKEAGALIMPAMPGFYHKPETVDDMVDFMVGKALDALGIEHELFKRWH